MQIYGWEFLPVCHHIRESGYIFLICHATICLKDYVTLCVEASCGTVPPFHVSGYRSHPSGDMKYLICHVTSLNHMIEGSSNFMSGNSSLYVAERQYQRVLKSCYHDSGGFLCPCNSYILE